MTVRRVKRYDKTTKKTRSFLLVDVDFERPDGTRIRVRKVSPVQTRRGAEEYERQVRGALLSGQYGAVIEPLPTFDVWFWGRFWKEWVVARKNKPSEIRSKKIIYRVHLAKSIGPLRLDQIDVGVISRLKAALVEKEIGSKRINNILAVISKPLRYAVEAQVLTKMPRIGMLKTERPEIVSWEFDQLARLIASSKTEGDEWHVAVLLGADAGLRIGEVKGLRWGEDVDLVAGTLTVNQQTRNGITGTPKGRTRRTVPLTPRLLAAMKSLSVVRVGLVVRNQDGSAKTDGQADVAIQRICRRAGLPVRYWHVLRHSFGTHAALFGVNPWRLQGWMGHKRIDETMLYVHVAGAHMRVLPDEVVAAGTTEQDPDRRVVQMLGARGNLTAPTNTEAAKRGEATAS